MQKRILVIDDDEMLLEQLEVELGEQGWSPICAKTAEAGLKEMEQEPPDLVLLDLEMPGMGGQAALEHIRRRWPDLPVIINSSHNEELLNFKLWPADEFVVKSHDTTHLMATVRRLIG